MLEDTETPQSETVPALFHVALNSLMTVVIGMTDTAFDEEGEPQTIPPTCVVRIETINGSHVFAGTAEFWESNASGILEAIRKYREAEAKPTLLLPGDNNE